MGFAAGGGWSGTEEDICKFFENCGEISQCELLYTHDGKSRGIAFVTFRTKSALQAALQLSGTHLKGRTINVSETTGQGKRESTGKGKGKDKGKSKGKTKDKDKGDSGIGFES